MEMGWILSRKTTLEQVFIDKLKDTLKAQKVDVSTFVKVDQSCPLSL